VVPIRLGCIGSTSKMSLALEGRNDKFVRLVNVKLSLLDSLRGNVAINNLGDSFAHILDGKFHEATSTSTFSP
jgi:hypothetical protein